MSREEMSREAEIEYVNRCFDEYEKEGFSKVFISPNEIGGKVNRQGTNFKVLGRVSEDEADLETLPMWKIQFNDGETMAAYPEEIIPSEIKNNLWRESDKEFLRTGKKM